MTSLEESAIASVTYTSVSRRIIFIVRILPYEMFNQSFFHPHGKTSTLPHRIAENLRHTRPIIMELYNPEKSVLFLLATGILITILLILYR